jgi:hypothetical protein
MMPQRTYPGRLTRPQWLKLSNAQRYQLATRADADLLALWRGCSKKPCRRAHACLGDQRCRIRPYLVDFNNPNFGRPDYVSSYRFPEHLRIPSAILDHLAFWLEPPAPEQILEECAAEAGAKAAAALRRAFRLERRRHPRMSRG